MNDDQSPYNLDSGLLVRPQLWINGEWQDPDSSETFEVVNPANKAVIGSVPRGSATDANAAVEAAAGAFEAWSSTPWSTRQKFVSDLVAAMEDRASEMAALISAEVGTPLAKARDEQVGWSIDIVRSYIEILDEFETRTSHGDDFVFHEPAGVVVAITPWNLPLLMTVQKVVPAIAAGCTLVLKPSEVTPLNAFLLADIIASLDLPAGVFNLVSGDGETAGETLVTHPETSMISFTGSTRAGRRISHLAADEIKRVGLELGGKSANLILPDADFEKAVRSGVGSICFNTGQSCAAWSRMLVPRERHDEAVEIAQDEISKIKVGDPAAEDSTIGPLVSEDAFNRVREYMELGSEEGAELVAGGPAVPEGLDQGYFVQPTIFAGVDNSMRIAREEIFGPVLTIIPYDSVDDAVDIANDTIYGLHGAVWGATPEDAIEVARRVRTGMISINGGTLNLALPWGGVKQSGIGRELGVPGLEEFMETKTIQMPK